MAVFDLGFDHLFGNCFSFSGAPLPFLMLDTHAAVAYWISYYCDMHYGSAVAPGQIRKIVKDNHHDNHECIDKGHGVYIYIYIITSFTVAVLSSSSLVVPAAAAG
jgi:hypothetical protein